MRGPNGLLVLAEALAASALERYGVATVEILGRAQGAALEHQILQHPFYARQVPVILGEHVTTDAGTFPAPDGATDGLLFPPVQLFRMSCFLGDQSHFFFFFPACASRGRAAAPASGRRPRLFNMFLRFMIERVGCGCFNFQST